MVSQVHKPECLLSRNAQQLFQTVVGLSAEEITSTDHRKSVIEGTEPQALTADPVGKPKSFETGCFMTVDKDILRDIVNDNVEGQATDLVIVSIDATVGKTFMDGIHLTTDFVNYEKRSIFNGLLHILIYRMIELGHKDFYLETRLSSLANRTMFVDSTISHNMTQKSFITQMAQFVKSTEHDQL